MSIREEYYKLKNKNIAPLPETKKEENFFGFLGKSLSTGAYALSKVGTGVLQGAENIADFTTHALGQGIGSTVGLINKEAGEKVKEFAKKSAEHDIIDTLLTQHVDKVYGENSYAKDIVGGVAGSIGEMIPSAILGGGASKVLQGSKILADMSMKGKVLSKTANIISKTGGMLPFMAGASGNSVNEALDNGANYDEALKYGALSGASEGAIEGLFGGIGGLTGKGINGVLNNKIVNKVINTTAIKEGLTKLTNTSLGKAGVKVGDITINGLGEGVEEVASAILNPYLKRLTYDEQAELASNEELMKNFTMGVLTSVLFQGGASLITKKSNNTIDNQEIFNQEIQSKNGNLVLNSKKNKNDLRNINIANNQEIQYNNIGSESGVNDKLQSRRILENNNEQTRLYQNSQSQQVEKYSRAEYEQWEKTVKPSREEDLSAEEKEIKNSYKEQYGKNIVFFDLHENNGYVGGASLSDSNKIYIDRKSASEFGIKRIASHETLESDILHNKDINNDIIEPAIIKIIDDPNFQKQKEEFWKDEKGEIPNDYLIAKDILCDRFSEIENNEKIDYDNLLSQETNMTMDFAINNFYNELKNKRNFSNNGDSKTEGPIKRIYDDVLPPEMGKNRKWRDTVRQAEVLDKEMIKKVIKENKEAFEYIPQSNVSQVEKADSKIKLFGYEKSIESINSIYESGKNITAVDLAMAQRLLQEASKKGDYKTTSELLPKVAIMGTELGQAVQSLSIIKRLSPAGQLKYIQATLNRIKKNELEKIKDNKIENIEKIKNIKITEEMTEKILSTKNQQELDQAVSEVVNEIASKLPVSFFEKIDTWRYLSMLGNARTHIRNVIGNITMYEVRKVKDTLAAGIEDFVAKSNPNLIKERTKTLTKSTEYIKQFAKEQTKIAQNELSGQSKYTMENAIQRAKKAFGTEGFGGFIQKLADKNSSLLEFEDTIFKGKAYKKAFTDYLTANGMKNQQDIDNNPNLVKNANEYAVEEAMKATFQQYSALASLINRFENKNAGTKVIVGATVPFKKTLINIAKTGASYSPLGLAKSITYDLYKLNTGKITTPQFIDNISQGLTGTSIMAIGVALFNLGILNPGSDDDKEGKYEKALGKQEYSVKIGDKTFTLDWLSPAAMPLFAGAELAKSLTNDGETKIESISNMLTSTLDPMMSMSVLQGINDALNGFEENKIQSILENSISGYVSQMFPTLFGQFNKTIDDTVRTTSVSKDSSFGLLEKIVRTNMNKIPGMSFLLEPSTDVWGNEVKRTENIIERAVDNFLMPYNVKTDSTSTIDTELKKVYFESGNDKVIPTVSLSKTITYGGENYKTNSSSYTQYKKTYGQEASDKLEKLFKTSNYQKASYEEKAKMISEVYEYAKDEAKKEFLSTKDIKYTNKTQKGVKIYEKNPIIDAINSNISYKEAVYKRNYPSKYEVITSISDYQTYQKYNAEIQEIENKYKGKGTKYSTQKKNEIISTINSYKLNIPQKAMLIKQYYSSYKDYDKQIVKYINSQKLNIEQKSEILTELGFNVNNGRVVY